MNRQNLMDTVIRSNIVKQGNRTINFIKAGEKPNYKKNKKQRKNNVCQIYCHVIQMRGNLGHQSKYPHQIMTTLHPGSHIHKLYKARSSVRTYLALGRKRRSGQRNETVKISKTRKTKQNTRLKDLLYTNRSRAQRVFSKPIT